MNIYSPVKHYNIIKYIYKVFDFQNVYNVYLCKTLTFESYFNVKINYPYKYS